jgi:ATP-dependent DNA ligase
VRAQRFEGLVAKRRDSRYEPGLRSGAWQRMRVNQGQEFVIGGYTVGSSTFDALIFGYYENTRLIYAARTRNGFTPAVRRTHLAHIRVIVRFGAREDDMPLAARRALHLVAELKAARQERRSYPLARQDRSQSQPVWIPDGG